MPSTHDPLSDLPTTVADSPVSWQIFALARSHRAIAASLLAELGLFPGQELILMQLWDNDGLSQKELGYLQRADHSTIAKSINRLETAGLVSRRKSTEDGRVTLVHLTDAGRALEERTRSAWREMERRTLKGLSVDEQKQFVALTRKIRLNID